MGEAEGGILYQLRRSCFMTTPDSYVPDGGEGHVVASAVTVTTVTAATVTTVTAVAGCCG